MSGLLITGTSSDAGKSLVVTGLCRALARRGLSVAPYKAQNMSNHSMVCRDGAEIGRAQYLQAQAAGVEATSAMNPVLLKPGSDRRAHVVVRGLPAGELRAGEYATGRAHLAQERATAWRFGPRGPGRQALAGLPPRRRLGHGGGGRVDRCRCRGGARAARGRLR